MTPLQPPRSRPRVSNPKETNVPRLKMAAWVVALTVALVLSLFARWQQVLVMLIYVAYELKISPLRGRRRWGVAVTVLGFTVAYGVIYRVAPFFFKALLAQAEQR